MSPKMEFYLFNLRGYRSWTQLLIILTCSIHSHWIYFVCLFVRILIGVGMSMLSISNGAPALLNMTPIKLRPFVALQFSALLSIKLKRAIHINLEAKQYENPKLFLLQKATIYEGFWVQFIQTFKKIHIQRERWRWKGLCIERYWWMA